MSLPANPSAYKWTREARRSAPARLNAHSSTATAPAEVRERYAVTKHVHHRNFDASAVQKEAKPSRRKGATPALSTDSDDQDSDDHPSPVRRTQTGRFSRVGTKDLSEEDDDSDSSYNSFNLSLQKKALFVEDVDPMGLGLPIDERLHTSQSVDRGKLDDKYAPAAVYRVYRSFYKGDTFENGNLTANLMTGTNRQLFQRELSRPLFRWVHVENPTMNFSSFVTVVLDSPWLNKNEKEGVSSILKVARQKSDRSLRMPPDKKGEYIEPEYYEETIQQTVYHGFRSRKQKTESIRWICVPYFAIGATPNTVEKSIDQPPPSIFLKSGYVLQGKYFQVAELWCIVIGDGSLFTCARRSIPDLPGNLVNVQTLPPSDPERRSSGDRAPVLIVSDGGIRTWLLPVADCQTWPEFTAFFAELGVDFSDGWNLLYQDLKLYRKDWPKVIAMAQRTSIRLVLEQSDGDEDESGHDESDESSSGDIETPQPLGFDTQAHYEAEGPVITEPAANAKGSWHVFSLMATSSSEGELQLNPSVESSSRRPSLHVDEKQLLEDADEIDKYLSSINKRRGEKLAYLNCPEQSYKDSKAAFDTNSAASENERHLFKSARNILSFFYPLSFQRTVTLKFWGAINKILQDKESAQTSIRIRSAISNIHLFSRLIRESKEELFSKRSPEYNQTNVPHEFIQAWILILMYFILLTTPEAGRTSSYPQRARILLTQGKMKVIQRLQTVSLRDREAVSPLGIVSLLVGQLLQDSRQGPMFFDRNRLASSYWVELQQLTTAVRQNPLSRRYQDQFLFLKTELETITATLEDQQRVLVALDDSINDGEAKSVITESYTRQRGREASTIEFSLQCTVETLANVVEMERRRGELESWHFRTIETAKDRQEKAALTFTTVTVFFLPLTMLASVFGMNTSDIRNMNQGQGLFWVTAVPFCAFGLVAWLAYLGTLHTWMKKLRMLSGKEKAN